MAKIKVQIVQQKKKGLVKKLVWGIIALIGFLASLISVIDFLSNNKGYISRLVNSVQTLFSEEEQKPQPDVKKEIPVLKPQTEAQETKIEEQKEAKEDGSKLVEPLKEEPKKY